MHDFFTKGRSPAILSAAMTIATVLFCGPMTGAYAASSEWAETEGGRMRLTALPPDDKGVIRAVLDIDLMPGWKTYWRDPGESGIPPQVDFSDSVNVAATELGFPPPERIDDGYSVFAGYREPVVLPITIEQQNPGRTSRLQANVFVGICSTICIPFQASFTLDVEQDTGASDYERFFVESAFKLLPEPASEAFHAGNPLVEADGKGFQFDVTAPESTESSELFVSGPSGWFFSVPEPVAGTGSGRYRVSVISSPGDARPDGTNFTLLVVSGRRSMETELKMP
jgi:DsbC/DsbD-like thiol-disulfide interchange protein